MRVAILGNSGSGKSTLASKLILTSQAVVLDLDTIAWEPNQVAVPRDEDRAQQGVFEFCEAHVNWVVEGCYASLIDVALKFRPKLVFLDPGEEKCEQHCRLRPWEPHKYASREEQDVYLDFLLSWVKEYYVRDGDMSHARHLSLYESYDGEKTRITT